MKKITASVFVITLLGSSVYASGCSEMAAFNTKIKKALKTASFNEKTLADIRNLQSECKRQHDMGMSVSAISSCNKALDLVAVNQDYNKVWDYGVKYEYRREEIY